jgi:non-ribosomal peptide synthetase component F/carbon monoxide dehydrogenase subunit G
MRVDEAITIHRSPGEIWEVIGDPKHYSSIIHGVTRWEPCRPTGTTGVGARYAMRMRVGSVDVGGEVEVVEYRDRADLAWSGVTGIEQRGRWRVRELDPGISTLTLRIAYQSPGGLAGLIADQVSARQVRHNVRRTLDAVRARCEGTDGATGLPADGGPLRFLAHQARAAAVLAGAGVIRPVRPDRLLAAALEVHRWGTSLAGAYAAAAAMQPDAIALVDDAGTLTFADVDRRTAALARGLAGFGIAGGDRVAILCRNHSDIVEAAIALTRLGADAMLLDATATAAQVAAAVRGQAITAIVHDQDLSAVVENAIPASRRILAWTERTTTKPSLDRLRRKRGALETQVPERTGRFTVLATGADGTRGIPLAGLPRGADPALAILSRVPLRARQAMLIAAPISQPWGATLLGVAAALSSTVVLQRRFDPETALAAIAEHGITALVVEPVMVQQLIGLPARARRRHNITVLEAVVVGSTLPDDVASRFINLYGDVLYTVDAPYHVEP